VDGPDGRVDLVLPVVDGQIVPLPVQPADAGRAQAEGADLDAAFAQCSFQDRHFFCLGGVPYPILKVLMTQLRKYCY
jgi:hypothetical protein